MHLTDETLREVVVALRSAKSTLSALRIARRHRDLLFDLRLDCEAYLSRRPTRTDLQPVRLVNALALYYYRSGRPDQARMILATAAALPNEDLAWRSQTLVNLLRIDLKINGAMAAAAALSLADFLLEHGHSLAHVAPAAIEANLNERHTLLSAQTLPLLMYIFTLGEAVEPMLLRRALALLDAFPSFADSDALLLAQSLRVPIDATNAHSFAVRPLLLDFDRARACSTRILTDDDLLQLKRATIERSLISLQ